MQERGVKLIVKIAFFSTKNYEKEYFRQFNADDRLQSVFLEERLTANTVALAAGFEAVCVFTNDVVDAAVLKSLAAQGVRLVALRCAGYNNVDLGAADALGVAVVRVPAYSPYAVAEYTVGMILTLNRKYHKAYNRVREGNFTLDGLLGFDLMGKTVGVVGTGRIGLLVARILGCGFGCKVLAYDPYPDAGFSELEGPDGPVGEYVDLARLYRESDVISLHCPLTPETRHLVDEPAIEQMKPGVMLINTSRGGVVNACALIRGLKSGKIGYLGLDVYEEEADIFFEDHSACGISDDTLARLLTFPNVLITSHQAFFTEEALKNIAQTTLSNIAAVERQEACPNRLFAASEA